MPRFDQSVGRFAKKLGKGVQGAFQQKPVTPYDPNSLNYHAFADEGYAQGQATQAQGAADSNVAQAQAMGARGLDTGNADQSRAIAQGDRASALQGAGNIQGDAGRVRGVGGQMVDYANQGPGASAAEAQLKHSTDRNMAQAVALARSGRGGTGGSLALRQADQSRAQAQSDAAATGATLRAQEADAWRGRQLQALQGGASAYGAAGGLEGTATDAYLAQQGADQGMMGLDLNQQQNQMAQQQQNDAAALGWEQAAQGREGQSAQYAAMDQGGRMAYEQDRGGNQMDAQLAAAGYDQQRDASYMGAGGGLAAGAMMMMSDIRAKRRIKPATNVAAQSGGLVEGVGKMTGAMQALSAQSDAEALASKKEGQSSGRAALDAAAAAPGYEYEYKDPEKHGRGSFVGPMAQDLEKTPVGESVVEDTPDGKAINTDRLSLVNTAGISEQQRELDRLKQQMAALGGGAYG